MKKLLPPVLFLMCVLAMGLADWGIEQQHTLLFPYSLLGLPFIASGLIIVIWHNRLFAKLKTNIMPFNKPDILVVKDGLFKYTRNPMYLGLVLALFGLSILYQGAISSFIIVLLFFIIIDRWYVRFEEKAMLDKFDTEYKNYCKHTRRWL